MDAAPKHCKNSDTTSDRVKDEEDHSSETNSDYSSTLLLPGLPNHLAQLCLSSLKPSLLYRVSTSWRQLIYSPDFPPFFALYAALCQNSQTDLFDHSFLRKSGIVQPNYTVTFSCFDPISSRWIPLPNPPSDSPLSLVRRHPSFISRILPIQSIKSSGRLVLIAGTTHEFLPGLARPLIFDPASRKWYFGPRMIAPRRWCVTGSIQGVVYVASGIGARHQTEVARSLEAWDTSKPEKDWAWDKRAPFKDGRFSREAIEAIGYKGKLCMVNVKGKAPKEGAVYDVVMDRWEVMPRGMLRGWNGPATVDDEGDVIYVVDQDNGSLRKYDTENDSWLVLVESLEYLKGAEQVSTRCGKVCVVSCGGSKIVVVDVSERPCKVWIVTPPQGMETIAVHVLPRMSFPTQN